MVTVYLPECIVIAGKYTYENAYALSVVWLDAPKATVPNITKSTPSMYVSTTKSI